jgi:hypothetical protein
MFTVAYETCRRDYWLTHPNPRVGQPLAVCAGGAITVETAYGRERRRRTGSPPVYRRTGSVTIT